MGRVLLAYDPQIDRQVAIKIIQSFSGLAGADREEARERFLREARSAGKLLHPGIITLFDAGEVDGVLYLAMEYVQGKTLDAYCRPDTLLPVPVVIEMVGGAAEALHYANELGIIHRDIKPGNLMRTAVSTVKIMDFGLARGAESNLTQEGALLGTPSYMAPEQIRGSTIDGRGDLFSLGVVLYEMLTGTKPFTGDSISSVIYRIVNESPREASEAHARVGPELNAFLHRALAKRPEDRFQSGKEFAAALRDAAAREAGAAGGDDPTVALAGRGNQTAELPLAEREIPASEAPAPVRSSARPFVLGILLLIVALAAGAYWFRDELGLPERFRREPPVYETTVRAEPAGAVLFLNGEPLDPSLGGKVRFGAEDAPPLIAAEYECRREEQELAPDVDGSAVTLVLEPVQLDYSLDLGETVASVDLNGESLGHTPLVVHLELCRENQLVLAAQGHHDLTLDIPEAATPLQARTLLAAAVLTPIPLGMLVLPQTSVSLVYYVDGTRVDEPEQPVELSAGPHQVRAVNGTYWIDVTTNVDVLAGEEVAAEIEPPALATLVVFAFPANAKVDLRRPGGRWKFLADVPVRRKLAVGKYEVRVTLKPTGESRTRQIELRPGTNPDLRVSFGSRS